MTRLIPKNEATLRAILKLKEAGLHEVNAHLEFDSKECINSLKRCNLIEVTRTVPRKLSSKRRKNQGVVREMHMYSITERGRILLQNLDFPPARQMLALKVPVKRPQPKPQPMKSPPPPKETHLHKMQSFIVPMQSNGHKVMMAEIDGREVKITYGAGFEYEVYRPAPDRSRNYTPRPIRGILA